MNKIYSIVWNEAKQVWMSAAENVSGKGGVPSFVVGSLLAVSLLGVSVPVKALDAATLPTGGQIVAGQGNISQNGSQMTVNQGTTRLIANWATFNVGQNASVQFVQPSASSVALNRILDQNPSQIYGALRANGQVFLINPAGITFGPTAQVDVGGLVAASLNLSNENFLAGNYRFEKAGAAGSVLNQGNLRSEGGYLAFISPQVRNEGSMTANNGTVVLAAADKLSLDFVGDKLVTFTVDQGAVNALAENKGLIQADGGLVMMSAKAADSLTQSVVNNDGVIEAKGLTEKGGRILLDADGGQTTVSGKLDVSSGSGQGGRLVATGDRVLIKDGAHLTASGKTGGGEVLVGGSWQNSDVSVRQATGTVIQAGAKLEANATDQGDGGTVVAWSDITKTNSVTRAYGTFEARGGLNGGDGGRIETSGYWLDISGSRGGASAPKGKAGLWLLDPYNVTIVGANASGAWGGGNPDIWTPSADSSTILNTDINSKLEAGTNVTVTTNGAGVNQIGDITLSSAINKAAGNADVTLTLQAANSIIVDQAISNTGGTGKLHVVLDADNDNGARDGGGIVILNNDITTGGGNLQFGTGSTLVLNGVTTKVGGDVYVAGAGARSLTTNGGNVTVNGEMIVANPAGLTINTNNGNVVFGGRIDSGNAYAQVSAAGTTWSAALAGAASGSGLNVNDTYLATITSRLENAIAGRANNYAEGWLGGRRVTGIGSDLTWRWIAGPEAAMDGGKGLAFFSQNTRTGYVATGQNGTSVNAAFNNWNGREPNNWNGTAVAADNLEYESILQFTGTLGKWNDLPGGPSVVGAAGTLGTYVKETNLAASPVTITAGSGNVTFSGAVGTSKALASLNVNSSGTIAINGGAVTTEGIQTYNGNVTVGAASTVLTQTNANTDFTVQSGKSITNATGGDATLTIKTTGNILMDAGSSISSSSGKLNTIFWSDTDNSGSGHILITDGDTISTNGGNLVLAGGLDNGANGGTASDGIPDGYAVSNVADRAGVGIGRPDNAATAATTLQSSGGNITIRGRSTGANGEMGVYFAHSGTLAAGTGTLSIRGDSSVASGIELSSWVAGLLNISANAINLYGTTSVADKQGVATSSLAGKYTSMTAGAGGITIYGENSSAGTTGGIQQAVSLTTTNGGNILIETPDTFWFYNISNNHDYNAGSGNITIAANGLNQSGVGTTTFTGTGNLTVRPYTAATTIGIAGGAGTLQLPASYFTTNFSNGFSGITVGSNTAGLVTVGNTALSYNDPLTIKSGNSLFFSTSSSLSGNGNALTLWSRAGGNNAANDANQGSVWLPVGSSVNTGGGNIVIGGGTDPSVGYALGDTGAASDENNARYRGVTINGTLNAAGGNITIHGRGGVGVAARGVSIGGTVSTTGAGTVTVDGFANGVSDGLALGDSTVGVDGTISAGNGTVSLTGSRDTGSNGINASTAGSHITTTGTGNVNLTASSGNVSGTGYVVAGGTTTLNAANNISLNSTSNDFKNTVSVGTANNVSIIDSNALTLGVVAAAGTIDIASLSGDLTLTGAISTTNATANAIKLNAGKNAAAGTATGGDIIITGGTLSTGAGGFATVYSGEVAGSTGLTNLIGSGTGRFRYNSDETAANYTDALTAGINAIYRERPTVTVTAGNDSKTYNGLAYTGGNGVGYTGFANGDAAAILGGTLTYGGNSQGAINAGSYVITPSGLTNGRGYLITYANGALTVNKADLTVTANNDNRGFNGSPYSGGNGVTYAGFVNGENSNVLVGALSYAGNSQGAVNPGGYAIVPGGYVAGNYAIGYVSGVLTIGERTQSPTPPVEQKSINGSQDNSSKPGAPRTPENGPGSGSTTLAGVAATPLVTGSPVAEGGQAILSSRNAVVPVSFSSAGQAVNLQLGTSGSDLPSREVNTLPVFTQSGSGIVLNGAFLLKESNAALLLAPVASGPVLPPVMNDAAKPESMSFSLTSPNGVALQMSASLTSSGVLVISVPSAMDQAETTRAVLMGLQVVRQELKKGLDNVKSVVVLRN